MEFLTASRQRELTPTSNWTWRAIGYEMQFFTVFPAALLDSLLIAPLRKEILALGNTIGKRYGFRRWPGPGLRVRLRGDVSSPQRFGALSVGSRAGACLTRLCRDDADRSARAGRGPPIPRRRIRECRKPD